MIICRARITHNIRRITRRVLLSPSFVERQRNRSEGRPVLIGFTGLTGVQGDNYCGSATTTCEKTAVNNIDEIVLGARDFSEYSGVLDTISK